MRDSRFEAAQAAAEAALRGAMPGGRDDAWLADTVDPPRFGWDWDALLQGYFTPLHEWSVQHRARLRPATAALLIDALGGRAAEHGTVLAALELHHLSSVMLDDLRNGRDLSQSRADAIRLPLPAWVTVAYNTRQLPPVLVLRRCTSLPAERRERVAQRLARFLFRQGLGSTLDLWAAEAGAAALPLADFTTHLSVYVGVQGLGLACEVAALVAGLPDAPAARLGEAGGELGVAMRLRELAAGRDRDVSVLGRLEREPLIRQRCDAPPQVLRDAAARLVAAAIARAGTVSPAAAEALRTVDEALRPLPALEVTP